MLLFSLANNTYHHSLTLFSYSSAITSSLASYSYGGAVVCESFLHGNETDYISRANDWPPQDIWNATISLQNMQNVTLDGHSLVNRTPVDCFKYYDNSFNQRTNVLIVTKDDATPEPWSEHSCSSGARSTV